MSNTSAFESAKTGLRYGFFFIGVPIGMLVPRLAEIKAGLDAGNSAYGTAIAVGGIGSLIGNYLGGQLVHHFGSKFVARLTITFILLANLANAVAPSVRWLAVVALASGLTYSIVNIALNSQGVLIEQGIGKSYLPMGHAFWSLGTMLTSFASSLLARFLTPFEALSLGFVISLIGFQYFTRTLLPVKFDDRPHDDPTQLQRSERIPKSALAFLLTIATAQWLGLYAEIAVGDWSSVLLHEHFKVALGPNGFAFTAFLVAQLSTRLLSPRLIDRFGLANVARTFGLVGAGGFGIALGFATTHTNLSKSAIIAVVCLAYGFMGFGVATLPAAFASAAGRIPGLPSARALMVTGIAIAILNIIGRTTLAALAQTFELPIALATTCLALIVASLMTFVLHPERNQRHAIVRK